MKCDKPNKKPPTLEGHFKDPEIPIELTNKPQKSS